VWIDFWALGGFEACRTAAEILGRQGACVGLHGGPETGVGLAARLHLAASHPAFSAGLATEHGDLVRDVLRFPPAGDPDGSGYRVPAGPGLGVELDGAALRELDREVRDT
jgi:glucarate dehydratase